MGFTWVAVRVRQARSSTLTARSGVPYVSVQAINYLQDQQPPYHKDKAPARRVRGSFEPRRRVSVRVPWWCPVPPWRCGVPLRPSRVPRPAVVAGAGAGGVPWCWFSRLLVAWRGGVRVPSRRPWRARVARPVFAAGVLCTGGAPRVARVRPFAPRVALCGGGAGVPLPRVPWWWTWRACPVLVSRGGASRAAGGLLQSKGQKRRARGAVVRFRWLSKSARRGGLCVPWWDRTTSAPDYTSSARTSAGQRDARGVPCGLCNRGGGLFL